MEFNLRKTKDDLTRFFILYEHRRAFIPITAEQFAESESMAIKLYQTDSFFHKRIDMTVARIMGIIHENLK